MENTSPQPACNSPILEFVPAYGCCYCGVVRIVAGGDQGGDDDDDDDDDDDNLVVSLLGLGLRLGV